MSSRTDVVPGTQAGIHDDPPEAELVILARSANEVHPLESAAGRATLQDALIREYAWTTYLQDRSHDALVQRWRA